MEGIEYMDIFKNVDEYDVVFELTSCFDKGKQLWHGHGGGIHVIGDYLFEALTNYQIALAQPEHGRYINERS